MDIRLEDMGKMILEKQETLTKEQVLKEFEKFFQETQECKNYLLLSKEVDYYMTFQKESKTIKEITDNFWNFLSESFFIKLPATETLCNMTDIKMLEFNEDLGHLELWIAGTYFQLSVFDWGVEKV
jgi:hypothetical protein